MKFEFNYEDIMEKLDYITTIVEDSSVTDKMRNVIFHIQKDKVQIIGLNNFAICRAVLKDAEVTDFTADEYIQIRSAELSKFLRSLSTLRRTRIKSTYFEKDRRLLKLRVQEESASEDFDYADKLNQTSGWDYDIIDIDRATLKELDITVDKKILEGIVSKDIRVYLDNLLPLVSNEDELTNKGKIYFSDDFIFVNPGVYAIFMENNLRDEFKNINLTNRSAKFLSKVLTGSDVVEVGRTERYLIACTERVEAHIRYNKDVPNMDKVFRKISKVDEFGDIVPIPKECEPGRKLSFLRNDCGLVLEKIYLQDVLKRVMWVDEKLLLAVSDDCSLLELKNRRFKQQIPILKSKDAEYIKSIKFSLKPDVFYNLLLGSDDIFATTVFLYCIKEDKESFESSDTIVTTDSTGTWFCVLRLG